jgi:glycosyltransferase involved in cell wall biosynthesis
LQTVSIIIPTYNRLGWLRRTVDNILEQIRPPDEIIIVNDGSTDGTSDYLNSLSTADRRFIIFHQTQQGRSSARNQGLALASSTWLLLHDDDDLMPKDSLKRRLSYLEDHPAVEVLYGNSIMIDDKDHLINRSPRVARQHPAGNVFAVIALENLAPIHAYLFKRSCLSRADWFDPKLTVAEDWDFWIRLATHATFDHLPAVVAYYRIHPNMSSHAGYEAACATVTIQKRAIALPAFDQLSSSVQFTLLRDVTLRCLYTGEFEEAASIITQARQLDSVSVPQSIMAATIALLARLMPVTVPAKWLIVRMILELIRRYR